MVIVAAVDRSDQARGVISEADTLAKKFDDTVHVLHVMKRSEAIQAEDDSGGDDAVSVDELRGQAAKIASELLESHSTTAKAEAVGRIGDPAAEIVAYADEQDARYIVVSPQRRSQTGKLLFGSVAQSVLLNASCPVVSLRAELFD
ncbi:MULTISPECIES: universal stress protein [Halorussus]|uniref:universal stress protein n=1 Tax=Halorussus TaxID=1070314 RepID=UPI000E21A768|nr:MULTISPECIES: universal stress protein [Halorussus]NHN60210.1 universal stress protein [Halorussus sp. JP-T4]